MTDAPESEDEETLLLNVFQSVLERQPKVEPLAVLQTSAPAEVVSPVPILLNAVPLRLMTRGESPFTVAVAETKRFVEDAVETRYQETLRFVMASPVEALAKSGRDIVHPF
jgi:hypothetical protein